ncbi:hypothetical protein EIP86_007661 [Pleurotus ostreatoroseus]|nr:hypothetical protein EIP86_007661 [Pleurotus ostreatoroseus]
MSDACANYGFVNGSTCACPPGFGGSDCSLPACGGTIFQGSSRATVPTPPGNGFANLTTAGCTCEDNWDGVGCNVCRSANACQIAYNAVSGSSSSSDVASGFLPADTSSTGQNDTLTCNMDTVVYAASEMSCDVNNPTLQALYPLRSTLNILRVLNDTYTPIPNTTAFGSSGSIYAQLFYDGVEQFYCVADSCSQTLGSSSSSDSSSSSSSSSNSTGDGSSDWLCQNLKCHCFDGSEWCGAVPVSNLTATLDDLSGTLEIQCDPIDASSNTATCAFKQAVITSVFGSSGLTLNGCKFGECVRQYVIDDFAGGNSTDTTEHKELNGGVIAGLAVVGALVGLALLVLLLGWLNQRKAKRANWADYRDNKGGVGLQWQNIHYIVPNTTSFWSSLLPGFVRRKGRYDDYKIVLDNVSGVVHPGQMMAVLGPSGAYFTSLHFLPAISKLTVFYSPGAGKTTLIEILAGRSKIGRTTGTVSFPGHHGRPLIGFVPQQDILPPTLTVHEALLFAARLRLPECIPDSEKIARVDDIIEKLGLTRVRDVRIGDGEKRGISGGEMRRVSIGVELVAQPQILILDEPTSGLDSVSAAKVASVLADLAHDPDQRRVVIATIHQPSSRLYHTFDQVVVMSHGRPVYTGPGGFAPAEFLTAQGIPYPDGYNVADFLLDVASDPPASLVRSETGGTISPTPPTSNNSKEVAAVDDIEMNTMEKGDGAQAFAVQKKGGRLRRWLHRSDYKTTFLTQLEVLSTREWKILSRDYTLFLAHFCISCILGVFVGGLYYHTDVTIAGFQSRVGCLFFLGSLVAFSTLSALYHVVETRPLFLRERSSSYYSPTAWLVTRFIFDVIPLRIVPTIAVGTITYWMAGLAHDAAHFFKFLFIIVLYTLAMTLWNFYLGVLFSNGGIAILLSALSALYQMTYAGFFVHLGDIPPVLRWLQWLCPLKYALEALSVNEVGSGLMIQDTLEGVPVNVSASLIMDVLFGFSSGSYYRDVLVEFAFIAGLGLAVIFVVWFKVKERR